MYSMLPKCDPGDHCFHEGKVQPETDPPQILMVCCDCGFTMKTVLANYGPSTKNLPPQ